MSELILNLVRRKVDAAKVRRVSGNKGGEWHSPCPVCGGDDRFHIWPHQDGGAACQRAGVPGTFWCRKCQAAGDTIDLLKFAEGLDYKAACQELGIEPGQTSSQMRPLRQPKRESVSWAPAQWKIPSEKWRAQATKLALAAHDQLLANAGVLAYLAGRGLPLEAVKRYRFGYLEGEDKTGTCLYRARSAFDLPDKKSADGTNTRSSLWIPRGLTIPLWHGEEVHRLRLRRRKDDLREKAAKYLLLEGSGQAPMVLPPVGVSAALATWVVVEAELDACAVHHACDGQIGVLAVLTNTGKPDAAAHEWLAKAKRILVALDSDPPDTGGKRPGYQGWLWWKERYTVAKRWPTPQGKDPGEAFALGVNLAEWIAAAEPEQVTGAKRQVPEDNTYPLKTSKHYVVTLDSGAEFHVTDNPETWATLTLAGEIAFSREELARLSPVFAAMAPEQRTTAMATIINIKRVFAGSSIHSSRNGLRCRACGSRAAYFLCPLPEVADA
jgi:hypothetical protein